MKKISHILFLFTCFCWSQTDFSQSWEDFYSYNNVKDFIKVDSEIYAIVDNAVFIYDEDTQEIEKISSIQGLSGETTSSLYYSKETEKLVIGYQTGLLEIIDAKGNITIANDIERLSITGEKQVNHIAEYNNKLYLSTPFAIVAYDIENLQFGDTYFIGAGSTEVYVNQTIVFNDKIYAATNQGVFSADVTNPNLIDFNNWQQPTGELAGNFSNIVGFNGKLYASKDNLLYEIMTTSVNQQQIFFENVLSLKSSGDYLAVTFNKQTQILDNNLNQVAKHEAIADFEYSLNTAYAEENTVYLGTKEKGVLKNGLKTTTNYQEIHPEGPVSNDVFSITAQNNHLWVVYGGYDGAFTPLSFERPFSHFNGETWANTPFDRNYPARDLVHVTIDPTDENRAYISSWAQNLNGNEGAGGILVVENDKPVTLLNQTNSGLQSVILNNLPTYRSVRVNGTAFDSNGNFWVSNGFITNKLKKRTPDGIWSSFDLSSVQTNKAGGLTELIIDKTNTVWMGSRRNGVYVFNENGNRKKTLTTEITKGSLPDPNVRTLALDRNNRLWIGTQKGMVVFSGGSSVFDASIYDAAPIIIEDDGVARKLLGDQPVNSIAIDGADNKWFGTETGGVLATNSSGQETLYNFNKNNSPLPSNRILKIQVDKTNGKVFFATNKGIVAFNSNVSPYGDELGEVYAYPNPVRKHHNNVTIDGRNGTHLPRGTNVKIVDAAGRLVYETNVVENQEQSGGKVVWNKTNLAGRRVASGVYIVLLTLPDASEASSTKIAIIN